MSGHLAGEGKGPGWVRRVTARLHEFVEDHGRARRAARAQAEKADDDVDEAGRESFPASDPPTWTLGVERRDRER